MKPLDLIDFQPKMSPHLETLIYNKSCAICDHVKNRLGGNLYCGRAYSLENSIPVSSYIESVGQYQFNTRYSVAENTVCINFKREEDTFRFKMR